MKRVLYITGVLVVVLCGLGASLYFSLQPRFVPKIKLSQFETPEEIAKAVSLRLFLELKGSQIIALGLWPEHNEQQDVVKEILKKISDEKTKVIIDSALNFDVVLGEDAQAGGDGMQVMRNFHFRDQNQQLAEAITQMLSAQSDQKIILVTASFLSTQILKESAISRLVQILNKKITSISVSRFPSKREQEPAHPIQCQTADDRTGVGPFACAIVYKARSYYRKKHDPLRWNGSLDLIGESDYLLLVNGITKGIENP